MGEDIPDYIRLQCIHGRAYPTAPGEFILSYVGGYDLQLGGALLSATVLARGLSGSFGTLGRYCGVWFCLFRQGKGAEPVGMSGNGRVSN